MDTENVKVNKRIRQKKMIEYLHEAGKIYINEIAERYEVTTETARKDLIELEEQNVVKRFHGGAVLVQTDDYRDGVFLKERMEENVKEKLSLVHAAISLVRPRETVIIDSGSTMYMLAKSIVSVPDITVITSSLPVAMYTVAKDVRTIILGGEIFKTDTSVGGPLIEYCLSNLYADIAFIGASGIHNPMGPEVENFTASNAKSSMLAHAKRKYIMADSSKYSATSLITFTQWEKIDGIIVDSKIPKEFLDMIGDKTKVIVAEGKEIV